MQILLTFNFIKHFYKITAKTFLSCLSFCWWHWNSSTGSARNLLLPKSWIRLLRRSWQQLSSVPRLRSTWPTLFFLLPKHYHLWSTIVDLSRPVCCHPLCRCWTLLCGKSKFWRTRRDKNYPCLGWHTWSSSCFIAFENPWKSHLLPYAQNVLPFIYIHNLVTLIVSW